MILLYFNSILIMSNTQSDNLATLHGSILFTKNTNIMGLPGHRLSFVFPYSVRSDSDSIPKNVVLTGVMESQVFAISNEKVTKLPKALGAKFTNFGGKTFDVPKHFQAAQKKGLDSFKSTSGSAPCKALVGSYAPQKPRAIRVDHVVLILDEDQDLVRKVTVVKSDIEGEEDQIITVKIQQEIDNLDLLQSLVEKVNEITQRNIRVYRTEDGRIAMCVPANMILQNLTSMENMSPLLIIGNPVQFPDLHSRLTFQQNTYPPALVTNYYVDHEKKVQVVCTGLDLSHNRWVMEYSKVYSNSEDGIYTNPMIVTIISPTVYPQHIANYRSRSRQFIFERSRVDPAYKIFHFDLEKSPLRTLCIDRVTKKTTFKDIKTLRGNDEYSITSFVRGECYLPGLNGSPNEYFDIVLDAPYDGEIQLSKMPKEAVITSFVSNAVNGNVFRAQIKNPIFFSTQNGHAIDYYPKKTPYFGTRPFPSVCTIDLLDPTIPMGTLKPNPQPGKPNQLAVHWVPCNKGIENYMLWLTTHSNHPKFNGKGSNWFHATFQTAINPEIGEIFDFVSLGYTDDMHENPQDYPWTHRFMTEVLEIDGRDLISTE